jgi:trans-2,3-dihydro-3-hydroxyanthranilate isomerase
VVAALSSAEVSKSLDGGMPPLVMANVTLRYVICDVFTDRPLEGNQLAVFTNATKISDGLMQRLARELNFSETTFVLPPSRGGHARVRIFTPKKELPFAGHPTLGTAAVIGGVMEAVEVRLELDVGVVPVWLSREGARVTGGTMAQPMPEPFAFDDETELLAALGVDVADGPIGAYRNGPSHLVVPVGSRAKVASTSPDLRRLAALTDACVSVCVLDDRGVKTRVFAPGEGIDEDPATGSAAGPVAVHLRRLGRFPLEEEVRFEQGVELGRPSELLVKLVGAEGELQGVEVGGGVQIVARGEFRVPA